MDGKMYMSSKHCRVYREFSLYASKVAYRVEKKQSFNKCGQQTRKLVCLSVLYSTVKHFEWFRQSFVKIMMMTMTMMMMMMMMMMAMTVTTANRQWKSDAEAT